MTEKKPIIQYVWFVLPVTYLFYSGNQDPLVNGLMFSTLLTLVSGCVVHLNQQLSPQLRINSVKCMPVCTKCLRGLRTVGRLVVPQDPEEAHIEKLESRNK